MSDDIPSSKEHGSAAVLATVGLIWAVLYWLIAGLIAWGSGGADFDESPSWVGDFNLLNGVALGVAVVGLVAALAARAGVRVVLWCVAAMFGLQLAGIAFALTVS